jgi:hypothetical protein
LHLTEWTTPPGGNIDPVLVGDKWLCRGKTSKWSCWVTKHSVTTL